MPLGAIGRLWYHQRYASSKVLTIRQGTFISDPSGIFQKESHMSSIHFLKPASAFGLAALLAFGGIPASALAAAQYAWADETAPQTASANTGAENSADNDTSGDSPSTDTPQIPDPTPSPEPEPGNLNLSPPPSRPSPLSPPLRQDGTSSATHGTGAKATAPLKPAG